MTAGNFGESITFNSRSSVQSLIKERILNTVYLGIVALGITLVVAIPIGIYFAPKTLFIIGLWCNDPWFCGISGSKLFLWTCCHLFIFDKNGFHSAQGTLSSNDLSGFGEFKDWTSSYGPSGS